MKQFKLHYNRIMDSGIRFRNMLLNPNDPLTHDLAYEPHVLCALAARGTIMHHAALTRSIHACMRRQGAVPSDGRDRRPEEDSVRPREGRRARHLDQGATRPPGLQVSCFARVSRSAHLPHPSYVVPCCLHGPIPPCLCSNLRQSHL